MNNDNSSDWNGNESTPAIDIFASPKFILPHNIMGVEAENNLFN